jgi:hypothetical protein
MTEQERDPNTGAPAADRGSATGTPRWVKVFGVITVLVVVLFVVVVLVRGGEHGPGRHSGGGGSDTPSHTGPPPGITHTRP